MYIINIVYIIDDKNRGSTLQAVVSDITTELVED